MKKHEMIDRLVEYNMMSELEYRNYPAVNKSTLWNIRKSPAHYRWALENPTEDTPALRFGRAVHELVLQPNEFLNHYCEAISVDRRTKDGKQAWEEFCEKNAGKTVLTHEEVEAMMGINASIYGDTQSGKLGSKYAMTLLGDAITEIPMFWVDPATSMQCKCRLDAIDVRKDKIVISDLKTTGDASTDQFMRVALKYGYHVQAAHYIRGVQAVVGNSLPIEWYFVAVEKKPPYAVNVIKAGDAFLDRGVLELMDLMDRLKDCIDKDEWPDYGVNELILPDWALLPEDDDDE